jgi:hypothetical protein
MSVRRPSRLAALLAVVALAVVAAPASAKEFDAQARLDAPVDGSTPGGTMLTIGYRAWVGDGAARSPLFGSAVFVRLISPTGESVTEFGTEGRETPGHYVATLAAPAGGIVAVEVGMRGQQCTDGGDCRTVDQAFTRPVENALVHPAAATPPATPAAFPTVAAAAAAIAALLALLVLRRRRPVGVAAGA